MPPLYDERLRQRRPSEFDARSPPGLRPRPDREDASAAAMVEDTLHPARRDEDRMARIIARAGQGVYSGRQADFAAEQARYRDHAGRTAARAVRPGG